DVVSLATDAGETVELVGESGCGKSTLARCLLRLIEPTAGRIRFDAVELTTLGEEPLRRRRRDIQMVFQDPTASLNPRFTVRRTVEDPLRLHSNLRRAGRRERAQEVLGRVGLVLAGEVPSPIDVPTGCRLRFRCPLAQPVCAEPVALREVAPRHLVACHLV